MSVLVSLFILHWFKRCWCKGKHSAIITKRHKKNCNFIFIYYLCAMINEFKVITLCGSTRFKEQFLEVQKRLTLEGNVVISVGLFGHSGDEEVWKPGIKEMLDRMHLSKIDMADEVYVINVDGYIGESTRREIEYAQSKGKTIKYYMPLQDNFNSIDNENNALPTIDQYIVALSSPLKSLHRLKRFRPFLFPDGSLDFWNDDDKIVFHMIDSLQEDYHIGMECCLNEDYLKRITENFHPSDDVKLYRNELSIDSFEVSVIVHRSFLSLNKSTYKINSNNLDEEDLTLSDDKKRVLFWNHPSGNIGKGLDSVIIPEGIVEIADGAFAGCENLEFITFPSTLKIIGKWAFADCGILRIHNNAINLEVIEEFAFYNCFLRFDKIQNELPWKVRKLNLDSFTNCYLYFDHKEHSIHLSKNGNSWDILYKIYPENNLNTEIEEQLSNTIEDADGVVYDHNFKYVIKCNNKNLTKYKIKESAVVILEGAFMNIDSLSEIDLTHVQCVSERAFAWCTNLNTINFGNGLKEIGPEAFAATGIRKLLLPKSLTKIGYGSFMGCEKLESVHITLKIAELPASIFENCRLLRDVKINDSIKIIGRMAFRDCRALSAISLPSGIRKLGELCFLNCPLSEIVLPHDLISMDYSPFGRNVHLKIISNSPFFFADELFLLGYNKSRLISYLGDELNIVVPGTVKSILGYSLCNTRKAKRILLPDSVVYIGHWAFRFAKAECINFPRSVTFIKSSFDYNSSIEKYVICSTQRDMMSGSKSINTHIEEYQ